MCKSHKHAGNGDAERKPFAVLRKMGKKKRVSRHDPGWEPDTDQEREERTATLAALYRVAARDFGDESLAIAEQAVGTVREIWTSETKTNCDFSSPV